MSRRLVLFDIDGTLLHSGGAGRRAVLRAVAALVPLTDAAHALRFDGKTDPQIVMELLEASGFPDPRAPEVVQGVCEAYVAHLEAELAAPGHGAALCPGVPELLDRLERHAEVVLGLLTGNVARGARLKLAAVGVDPARFVLGAYGSDSHHRPDLPAIAARRAEPHLGRVPAGADVVIIGDTPADVTCGRGIGARPVAVATGHYPAEALRSAGAVHVFTDLTDTDRVLEAILWDRSSSN